MTCAHAPRQQVLSLDDESDVETSISNGTQGQLAFAHGRRDVLDWRAGSLEEAWQAKFCRLTVGLAVGGEAIHAPPCMFSY